MKILLCVVVGSLAWATPLLGQGVSGHVYITLGDGSSQLVRGSEIRLVCASEASVPLVDSALALVRAVGTATERSLREAGQVVGRTPDDIMNNMVLQSGIATYSRVFLPRLNSALVGFLESGSIGVSRTTFEGAYSLNDVAPGSYYLFARYKTNFNDGIWLERIDVPLEQAISVDLSNHNLVDLRELSALDHVEQSVETIDGQIARWASNAQKMGFAQGKVAVAEQAGRAELPALFKGGLPCTRSKPPAE